MLVKVKRTEIKSGITYTLLYPASIVTIEYMQSVMDDQNYITEIEFENER